MKLASIPEIEKLGSILGVWAHPDDESFSSSGVMAAAARNGQQVACITATKGELGLQDSTRWTLEGLAEVRAQELRAALDILGVTHHHWLEYRDGNCANVPDEQAVNKVVSYIKQYKPDTIITFPPNGITGHDDHRAVSRWTRLALDKLQLPIQLYYVVDTQEAYDAYLRELDEKHNIYFNIDSPTFVPVNDCDLVFELPPEVVDKKVRALKAMPSQTSGLFANLNSQQLAQMFAMEAFVRGERTDLSWN